MMEMEKQRELGVQRQASLTNEKRNNTFESFQKTENRFAGSGSGENTMVITFFNFNKKYKNSY